MSQTFAAVINYQLEGEQSSSVILDTINDTSVQSNTTITQQPVVSGDEISDHQFKLPKTMTLTGTCSLNGSQGIVVDGTGSKLANFQDLFEKIQDQGVLCNIMKISLANEKDVRFLQRTNMVLESISWRERINTLEFTLNFRQVIIADVVQYEVDIDDAYLPNITEPSTTSFTNTLIDWSQVDSAVLAILDKEKLWTTEFKNYFRSLNTQQLQVAGIAAGAAIVIAAAISALNVTPVGWVLTAIGLAVGSVVMIGKAIVNAFKKAKKRRKYAIKQFKYYKNSSKNKQELERFSDFLNGIHEDVESLNDILHVYQLSINEPQEAMISVGDDYYIFTFTKNNTNQKYSLSIENVDKSKTGEMPDIEAAPTDIGEITSSNYLVKANNNARIYLVNPTEDKKDLTNYFILVCDFNPDDFNKLIEDIIKSHIYRNAG